MTASADQTARLWDIATRKEIRSFIGHQGPIQCLAVSPDGQMVVTGSQDNTLRLWDLPQLKPHTVFQGHGGPIRRVAINSDSTLFISAGQDKTARLWQISDAKPVAVLEGHADEVVSAAIRPDGQQIATADRGGFVRLFGTLDYKMQATLGAHHSPVTFLGFHPNNQLFLSTSDDGTWKVWQLPIKTPREIPSTRMAIDRAVVSHAGKMVALAGRESQRPAVFVRDATTGVVVNTLLGHEAPITAMAFDDQQNKLVTSSEDGTARVWDLKDPKFPELTKFSGHGTAVTTVAFSRDAAHVFSGGRDRSLRQWSAADGKQVREVARQDRPQTAVVVAGDLLFSAAGKTVQCRNAASGELVRSIEAASDIVLLAVSADHQRIAVAAADGHVRILKVPDFREVSVLRRNELIPPTSLGFSQDGQRLALTAGRMVRVFDAASGLELQLFAEHAASALGVAFAPDSQTLLSADAENVLRVSSISAGRAVSAHDGPVTAAALVPGGDLLVTIGADKQGKLWNVGNGQLVRTFLGAAEGLTAVAARLDNVQLAAGSVDGRVYLWNLGDASLTGTLVAPAAVTALAFSPDNQKLAVASRETRLQVFGLADQSLHQEVSTDSPSGDVVFLPDNRRLISGHGSGHSYLWSYASPVAVRTLAGHGGPVYAATFTGDGKSVISASADQTIRVWDVATGNQRQQMTGHQGPIYGLAINSDSSLIASAGADNSLRMWDVLGGRQLKQLSSADAVVYSLAFHPDGKTVATGGADKKIRVYNLPNGTLDRTIEGHPDFINGVVFNRQGSRLASCGYSGNVFIWNPVDGQQLFATKLDQVANSIAYSPDGTSLATAGADGTARIVSVPVNAR